MGTQNIINLLNYCSNEESKFATKNGMSQTVKQQKMIQRNQLQLNLKQKPLNQVFAIILMYIF